MYCEDEKEQQQALPTLNEYAPDAMVGRTYKGLAHLPALHVISGQLP